MPHPLDDDTQHVLDTIRRTMLAIKIESMALGPNYKMAQAITLITDLIEYLLQREHTHAGGPYREPTFGGR